MNPLASFTTLIATAESLAAAVNTRDNLHLRPPLARKAVAARLVSGIRLLRAFLRRLIILIALDLEWSLIDKRGVMKRPHKCQATSTAGFALGGLDLHKVSPWLNADGPNFKPRMLASNDDGRSAPVPVDMARLYAQLDFLGGIAANPIAKAQRLAFHPAPNKAS
jgi:hypothetical protein